jgi:SAM-dependent methyltransferase
MYAAGEDRWDLGGPSPPLVAVLGRGEIAPPGRALVPGCGAGHDALLLAARGFDAVGVDFAPRAIREARRLAAATGVEGVRFERRDLFRLPRAFDGAFDLAFEQTCFCAVHPGRRDEYVRALHRALRPGGLLVGLFFVIRPEEGPPFGTTPEEVRHRFASSGLFRLEGSRVPAESVTPRQGREWLAFLRSIPRGRGQ